ncbi:uncharacterized protein ACN63O_024299 [Diretmus argenteus]
MEADREASAPLGIPPALGQAPVRTWRPSSRRGAAATAKMPGDTASRFHGDGVRYKAKIIGVDPVPDIQGDKMTLDSMMKLKGLEAASRSQGKHKQRVLLMVSTRGLKIVDERTGAVQHDHDSSRISSLRKDESDPRALAYIYQSHDRYTLFYIRTANMADPVLDDIKEVCQSLDRETLQQPAGKPTDVSPNVDLMDAFSIRLTSQTNGSPQRTSQSTSQILSNYSVQPVGGSPYSSPTTMPWGQQGPLGSLPPSSSGQWACPAPPWPTQPGSVAAWAPSSGVMASGVNPQPWVTWGHGAAGYPSTGECPVPLTAWDAPSGLPAPLQPVSPTTMNNPSLG